MFACHVRTAGRWRGVYTQWPHRSAVPARSARGPGPEALCVAGLGVALAALALAFTFLAAAPAGALPDLQVVLSPAANVTDGGSVAINVTLTNAGDMASVNASVSLA